MFFDVLWKWCKTLELESEYEEGWRRFEMGIIGISKQFAFVNVFQIQMQHYSIDKTALISYPICCRGYWWLLTERPEVNTRDWAQAVTQGILTHSH